MTLLQLIEQEIQNSGGRLNLARQISEENVSLFTAKYRREIKQQAIAEMKEQLKIPYRYLWSQKDTDYLMAHWKIRYKTKVAHALRRSYHACECRYSLQQINYRQTA